MYFFSEKCIINGIKSEKSFLWPQKLKDCTGREWFTMYLSENTLKQTKSNISKFSNHETTECNIHTENTVTGVCPKQRIFYIFLYSWN